MPLSISYILDLQHFKTADAMISVLKSIPQHRLDLIELRAKTLSTREQFQLALQCRDVVDGPELIVNDDPALAVACEADGVHLGQDDLPAEAALNLIGDAMTLGVSVHTEAEMAQAVADGVSYVACGSVFDTKTKDNVYGIIGVDGLVDRVRWAGSRVPVTAIGGIEPKNVEKLSSTGIKMIWVGAGISLAKKPAEAIETLWNKVGRPDSD